MKGSKIFEKIFVKNLPDGWKKKKKKPFYTIKKPNKFQIE